MNIFFANLNTITVIRYTLTLLILATGPALAGKLYHWVDEQGHAQFTDTIPPGAVNLSREILNSEGVPIDTIDRAKTPEEMRQQREQERLQAESRRLQAEQEAADSVLLRTFRTEDDIIMARNGKLDAVNTMIQVAQSSIRHYQDKLTEQQYKQAGKYELSAKIVPQSLQFQIQDTLKRINDTYAIIRREEQEKQAIMEAFNRDIKRFRVLKNLTQEHHNVEDQAITVLDNLIPCGEEAACDEAWVRAEAFVVKYATTTIQIEGDSIVMAKAPAKDEDISITISRIVQAGQPTMLFMDLFCKNSPVGHDVCESPNVKKIRQAYRREVGGLTN